MYGIHAVCVCLAVSENHTNCGGPPRDFGEPHQIVCSVPFPTGKDVTSEAQKYALWDLFLGHVPSSSSSVSLHTTLST